MHWTDKVGKNNETLPNKIKAILEKKTNNIIATAILLERRIGGE